MLMACGWRRPTLRNADAVACAIPAPSPVPAPAPPRPGRRSQHLGPRERISTTGSAAGGDIGHGHRRRCASKSIPPGERREAARFQSILLALRRVACCVFPFFFLPHDGSTRSFRGVQNLVANASLASRWLPAMAQSLVGHLETEIVDGHDSRHQNTTESAKTTAVDSRKLNLTHAGSYSPGLTQPPSRLFTGNAANSVPFGDRGARPT